MDIDTSSSRVSRPFHPNRSNGSRARIQRTPGRARKLENYEITIINDRIEERVSASAGLRTGAAMDMYHQGGPSTTANRSTIDRYRAPPMVQAVYGDFMGRAETRAAASRLDDSSYTIRKP